MPAKEPCPISCDEPPADDGGPSPELEAELRRIDADHPGLIWLTQDDVRSHSRSAPASQRRRCFPRWPGRSWAFPEE
jgi:hypothetical protein